MCLVAGIGCQDRVCSLELREVIVTVTDANGTPISGLQTTSIDGNTGQPFATDNFGAFDPGEYVVVNDNDLALIGDSDVITFTAEGPEGSATGEWNVAADDCHITSHDGPETLVLH